MRRSGLGEKKLTGGTRARTGEEEEEAGEQRNTRMAELRRGTGTHDEARYPTAEEHRL